MYAPFNSSKAYSPLPPKKHTHTTMLKVSKVVWGRRKLTKKKEVMEKKHKLVGGFNPFEKY